LLLVFASQKTVHYVRDEIAEEIKDSLTRQGMQNMWGLHRKGLAEREEKKGVLPSERAHRQVLTVKENMHPILQQHRDTCHSGHFHRAR